MPKKRNVYDKSMAESLRAAAEMSRDGFTDKAVSAFIGCSRRSVINWREKHDEFHQALLDARQPVNEQVVQSLFQLAVGYESVETKVVYDKEGQVVKTEEVTKQVAGNPTSCFFWLQNRDRENWRRSDHVEKPESPGNDDANLLDVARRLLFAIAKAEHEPPAADPQPNTTTH